MVAVAGVDGVVDFKLAPTWSVDGLVRVTDQLRSLEQSGHIPVEAVDAVVLDGRPVLAYRPAGRAVRPNSGRRLQAAVRFVSSDPVLGPTLAAMRTETRLAEVLAKTDAVASRLSRPARRKMMKGDASAQARTGKGTTTVNDRLKLLHETSPKVAEEKSLRVLAKMLNCVPSAIVRVSYYKNQLGLIRAKIEAEKKNVQRANASERYRAEDQQALRDNREHIESYEDIDAHIDATWDERQGGRFKG